MDRSVPVACGTIQCVTAHDPDILLLKAPRGCVALSPDAVMALVDVLTEHMAGVWDRQPPSMSLFESEPF